MPDSPPLQKCPFMAAAANTLPAVPKDLNPPINFEALKSDIRLALINNKSFACPIAMRVAWHASGTYDKNVQSDSDSSINGTTSRPQGGSNGATMRFEPEISDDANAGLHIVRDMLHGVKKKYGNKLSMADLWTLAGVLAVEFMGGPKNIEWHFGRTDIEEPSNTSTVDSIRVIPENGRLPDASLGAEHLREVFGRMGFDDEGIVALSGGHTVGRCHLERSGFDGPWTHNSLQFDNSYFKNLMDLEWEEHVTPKGKKQFRDKATGKLMMLPTDIALKNDPEFSKIARHFADNQEAFFESFAKNYGKLMSLGCPPCCGVGQVKSPPPTTTSITISDQKSAEFRERCMHGSLEFVQKLAADPDVNVHIIEKSSGRTALHKAAYWGHDSTVEFLISDKVNIDPNIQDNMGDTALHDACRFGQLKCVELLMKKTDLSLKNSEGQTVMDVAVEYGKTKVVALLG